MAYITADLTQSLAPWADAFASLERDLGAPIRVLAGRGRSARFLRTWTATQAQAAGNVTADYAREHGVTVGIWATSAHTESILYSPMLLPSLVVAAPVVCTDVLQPEPEVSGCELLRLDSVEAPLGEISERQVLLYVPSVVFESLSDEGFRALVGRPIERSLDPTLAAELETVRQEANRTRFLALVNQTRERQLSDIRDRIDNLVAKRERSIRQTAEATTDLRVNQAHLDAILRDLDYERTPAEIEEAWERLLQRDWIESLDMVEGDAMLIRTHGLDLTHPETGQTVYLGKLTIRLSLSQDAGDEMWNITNDDNPRGTRAHPHVHHGEPCFGEMGATVQQMLLAGRIDVVMDLLHTFLTSVNLEDEWGRYAAMWFEDSVERTLVGAE